MELINQNTKKIMEECKSRARDAGLRFQDETLEYIVTNRDLLELSPKVMIPTLYDFWVNDIEVLKNKAVYKVYPSNPYETVINSRPAISFYNDNNPDWLNIMIFYHVIGHIDFFQNNILFQKTWDDDFVGQALADKRLISRYRATYGRWLDYVIEFSRSIDNLCGYFKGLMQTNYQQINKPSEIIDYYFDYFLQVVQKVPEHVVFNEIDRYNKLWEQDERVAENIFLSEIKKKYPEFQTKFERFRKIEDHTPDVMEFVRDNSIFLKHEENDWMKSVMNIVRNTSLYFEPQMRTKIINEGWASYWHDILFRQDDRIKGHEIAYSKINAYVTSLRWIGLNPYAIGLRLIQHVEDLADKGKISFDYQKTNDITNREKYNKNTGKGKDAIFYLRQNFSDFMLINSFTDQEFIDNHKLMVVGKRLNPAKQVYEYYVKSRKATDYKQMLIDSLYHPPRIKVDLNKTVEKNLYLIHHFEGKQLHIPFIPDTLIGLEFLWGNQVQLETTEIIVKERPRTPNSKPVYEYIRVLYSIKDKKIDKMTL